MTRLLRDTAGAVLVEYSIVFTAFIVAVLGTIDATYMLYEWGLANKAAYIGVRKAVVTNPIAPNIATPAFTQAQLGQLGAWCFNPATGATNGNCPSVNAVCTPAASGGTCTNGGGWDDTAFSTILSSMQAILPRLKRTNVEITYQTNGLGFVDPSSPLPVNVTVSIKCMTHEFYFIQALMNWVFVSPAGCPSGLQGPAIPAFASTLPSEDLATN